MSSLLRSIPCCENRSEKLCMSLVKMRKLRFKKINSKLTGGCDDFVIRLPFYVLTQKISVN